MKVGLLWYDGDARKSSEAKIGEAARRYLDKFGVNPNTCHVNPDDPISHDTLRIVPNRWIRPNYYWIGVDEETVEPGGSAPGAPDAAVTRIGGNRTGRARSKKAG